MTSELPEGIETDRRARPRGWYGALKTWLFRTKNVTNLEAILAAIAVGGVVVLTVTLVRNESSARRESEVAAIQRDTEQATYESDVRVYDAAVAARALCIDSVQRSDNNREAWRQLADLVDSFGSEAASAAAGEIRSNAVLSQSPRSIDDCPTIPPIPTPPTREDS